MTLAVGMSAKLRRGWSTQLHTCNGSWTVERHRRIQLALESIGRGDRVGLTCLRPSCLTLALEEICLRVYRGYRPAIARVFQRRRGYLSRERVSARGVSR